jgi:hypothetical protein
MGVAAPLASREPERAGSLKERSARASDYTPEHSDGSVLLAAWFLPPEWTLLPGYGVSVLRRHSLRGAKSADSGFCGRYRDQAMCKT